jgi:hypothetical protein
MWLTIDAVKRVRIFVLLTRVTMDGFWYVMGDGVEQWVLWNRRPSLISLYLGESSYGLYSCGHLAVAVGLCYGTRNSDDHLYNMCDPHARQCSWCIVARGTLAGVPIFCVC